MRKLFVLACCACLVAAYWFWERMPPTPNTYVMEKIFSSAAIAYSGEDDKIGQCLFAQPITLSGASGPLRRVIIATEDRDFYSHWFGVSPTGMGAGILSMVHFGHRGGSTITQQLVKLTLFQPHDSRVLRKMLEIPWAIVVNSRFSKDDILTYYLNNIPFRHGLYGVEEASRYYFKRHASDLNYYEAALLEVMLSNPANDIESSDEKVRQGTYIKARNLLRSLTKAGLLERRAFYDRQRDGALPGLPQGLCGYIRDYVSRELSALRPSGEFRVLVTLAPRRQVAAVQTLEDAEQRLDQLGGSQMALVDLDRSGGILALQGGLDYSESQFDRGSRSRRSPGSFGKTIVLAAACEKNYTLGSIVHDVAFPNNKPKNDDGKYLGDISLLEAFVHSRNAAMYRLAETVGPAYIASLGHELGLSGPLPTTTGGMAVGDFAASPLEISAVTAAIANGGYAVKPFAIRSIVTAYGTMVYEHKDVLPRPALSPRCVQMVDRAMREVVRRGTARKANIELARGKTGTTNNYRDAWFSGYASSSKSSAVVTIWAGNDRTKNMRNSKGGDLPAAAFRDYISQLDLIGIGRQRYIAPRGEFED